jgi:hypothetical protein
MLFESNLKQEPICVLVSSALGIASLTSMSEAGFESLNLIRSSLQKGVEKAACAKRPVP